MIENANFLGKTKYRDPIVVKNGARKRSNHRFLQEKPQKKSATSKLARRAGMAEEIIWLRAGGQGGQRLLSLGDRLTTIARSGQRFGSVESGHMLMGIALASSEKVAGHLSGNAS